MEVFFDDLDAVGIVHNIRYLLFAERAVGAFWKKLGLSATPQTQIVAHAERFHLVKANTIEYLRPITGTCELRVRVWVEKLGTTSLTFGYALMPSSEDFDYAVGTRTVVSADPETKRPRPWSPALRTLLETANSGVGQTGSLR